MNKKKLLVYLVIPVGVSLALMTMYFSNSVVLQRIVCPKPPPMFPGSWCEFGLLENLENALVLAIFAAACIGAAWKRLRVERTGFALLALFAIFVFLEEIDYGLHFYRYLTHDHDFEWFLPFSEWPAHLKSSIDITTAPFNLHNRCDVTKIMKQVVIVLIVLLFVVAPFVGPRLKNRWARYLSPDKYAIFTAIAMLLLSSLTHYLGDLQEAAVKDAYLAHQPLPYDGGGAIHKNLSEFRELTTYYLFMVYVLDLVFYRDISTAREPGGTADADQG